MELKRTPLYATHKALGAKLVSFAGWEMPVQYAGVIDEHLSVRSSCGLFDVSHMGEIEIAGQGALELVQLLTTNDIERVEDGQCQYTLLCYPDGGVVDDCIVYRFSKEKFLFCVNASNTDKVLEWMMSRREGHASVTDLSQAYAQLALQGPGSNEVIRPLLSVDPASIRHFRFKVARAGGAQALVSRTGYTGEDGFEIYLEPGRAAGLWDDLMEAGRRHGIVPVGLGARDTLRLEMGYPLYGHELGEGITPLEAGLAKYVRLDKGFVGRDALAAQAAAGAARRLVGFRMTDAGIPRAGYEIRSEGRPVGSVSSGTLSPSLRCAIGMGFVEPALSGEGADVDIMIRSRAARATVVRLPFYRKVAAGTP